MTEKVLTIVVPSFNTESYIDKCLPTMIDQRFIEEIEILLINDGSTDGTKQILERYQQAYPNSIRVINKENGGHGSTINRGIAEARGRYFRVIDGDDQVVTDNLRTLVEKLKDCTSDMVFTPFIRKNINTGKQIESGRSHLSAGQPYSFEQVCDCLACIPLHAINYRTILLKENGLHFQEKCFYEDKEYILYPIYHIESITYFDIPVYIYNVGVPGQSVSIERVIKNEQMLRTIVRNLCTYYETHLDSCQSIPKRKYVIRGVSDVIKNMYGVYLKMPYGVNPFKKMNQFSRESRLWSQEIYNASNKGVVRLLRCNNFIIYSLAYLAFRITHVKGVQ